MAFKFRMQKILDLKEKEEDNKKNEVAVILKEISDKKIEIHNYVTQREEEKENRKKLNQAGCSVTKILDVNNYIQYIEQSIDLANEELRQLERRLKIKQDEYLEARKEKKSFEKLKEKDHEKYKMWEAKEEEKVIDQIVTYSSSKRKD